MNPSETQVQPNMITTATSTANTTTINCTACHQQLEGNFARALDGAFHWNCFLCIDCNEPVAEKFFPIEFEDGIQKPLCERDYFKRLNLACDNCGDALRGSYITAVGKKFHLEHFCCSICSVVFGPDDSYYEYDNNVYCHYHYSIQFAIKCIGCETAILKQFVEINRNNVDEHWHPECYMIHKFWNVKLAQSFGQDDSTTTLDLSLMTSDELKETQTIMEEKVYRIWTVLSAFEESAAGCISDMLLHVSEGSYADGVKMADYFVTHVDVLFTAIDDLADHYHKQTKEELFYDRESSMLCKKVSNFFSLLSHTQESGLRKIGITQDLLSLVTGLAHYLKVLIRIGLTGALKLEKKNDTKSVAISRFLSQLMELANKKRQYLHEADYTISSDLCQFCRKACEDACFRYKTHLWHDQCFACTQCCSPLRLEYKDAWIQQQTLTITCKKCISSNKDGYSQGVEYVSKLKQSSFLLRVALRRLYSLLNVPDPMVAYYGQPVEQSQHQHQQPLQIQTQPPQQQQQQQQQQQPPVKQQVPAQQPPLPQVPQDAHNEEIHLNDIKRMKSTHMNRKITNSHRVGKRSTLMETPSPTTAFVTNKTDENNSIHSSRPHSLTSSIKRSSLNELEGDLSQMSVSSATRLYTHKYTKSVPKAKSFYFAELGALQHFMLKHIAVLYLDEILNDHFTLEELADLIDDRKNSTLWGKFVTSLKAGGNKKVPRAKEGTFGVPIDTLVEKNGIESNLGVGPTRIIKIPSFIDDSISAMKQMDMSVEGIFRKNGNIRRLRELSEEIDKNPNSVQFLNETPIQVAALIKKFLRELPDPLLTYRLHRLFITAQKLDSEADRKRVTHLACCLLPKANRDTMEVLFTFMKWVSQFADDAGGGGSKMHTANLATVIAPNILYSKSKDPIKDESFHAIECVTIMIQNAEEFATVPEDFIPLLQNLSYEEGDMELNVRHILKKCEVVMKMRRSKSAAAGLPVPPQLPRQHSSPATVTTSSSSNADYPSYPPMEQPAETTQQPQTQQNYYLSSSPQNTVFDEPKEGLAPPTVPPIIRSQSSTQLNANEGGNLLVKELIQ
ncbi:Endocytosis and vacuole integrity protein [Mucor velutinosus]|uniref:Endocytosis and vacuole integrity protein n=1 Tax=Mucor velutinosus TaxID=708070 RepID=A0AAN7HWJ9_9FUNG|nr:Endocytosis and vacuole integrity protein [Mucor velutinosus]